MGRVHAVHCGLDLLPRRVVDGDVHVEAAGVRCWFLEGDRWLVQEDGGHQAAGHDRDLHR